MDLKNGGLQAVGFPLNGRLFILVGLEGGGGGPEFGIQYNKIVLIRDSISEISP